MNALTIQQRRAMRYRELQASGDHDLRAAERMRHAGSSTPNLQRHGESFVGVLLMLVVGVVILVLSASGVFK